MSQVDLTNFFSFKSIIQTDRVVFRTELAFSEHLELLSSLPSHSSVSSQLQGERGRWTQWTKSFQTGLVQVIQTQAQNLCSKFLCAQILI